MSKETKQAAERAAVIFEEKDLDILGHVLMELEDAANQVLRCKAVARMLGESACAMDSFEGVFPESDMYNIANIILDCSSNANEILKKIYNDVREVIRKQKKC